MQEELRFDGKVVVVTGAGAGLGRSHALLFAQRGAKVVVNDLGVSTAGAGQNATPADRVVAEIVAAGGTALANYSSVEAGDRIIKAALDAYGRVDIVVNNAGILRDATFHKMTLDDWERVYRVHLLGAFSVTHAAWSVMREQGSGKVLFTTSAAGLYGNFGQANYSAAKLALVGLCKTLALEGAKKNIQCNVIAPIAASRMTETVIPKELLETLQPEQVSPLVAWLCHDSCPESGGIFEVGGGFFSKLRWERTAGRTVKVGRKITVETIRDTWSQIVDFKGSTHPETATEALMPALENASSKSKGGNEWIDVDQALGFEMDLPESSYDERDLSLYALGVGAGQKPTDEKELHLTYERNGEGFWPLPTYGVVPAMNGLLKSAMDGLTVPGMNYGLDRVLHGEQSTTVVRPLPVSAKLKHRAKISEIWDKGKHALVVTHVDSFDASSGELLIQNDMSMVIRGAGGWGGERGPTQDLVLPSREADVVVTEKTYDNQALLYRLSGDWNPLHVDPQFSMMFGFERPILHNLCVYGFAARVVVMSLLGGDARKLKGFKTRFGDSVFPGEAIKFELWKESDTKVLLRATVVERNKVVLSYAAAEIFTEIPAAIRPAAVAQETTPQSNDVRSIFGVIASFIAQTPDVKQVGVVYQFKLKNPDSAWVIDTREGKVWEGVIEKPDSVLEMTDADWRDLVDAKAEPQVLFAKGKLKVSGNIMAAQKLETLLKRVDRKLAATVVQSLGNTSTPQVSAEACAPKVFQLLEERLHKKPALGKEVGAKLTVKVSNPDCQRTFDLGAKETTLRLSDAALGSLARGEATAQQLFMRGELKVDGDFEPVRHLSVFSKLL